MRSAYPLRRYAGPMNVCSAAPPLQGTRQYPLSTMLQAMWKIKPQTLLSAEGYAPFL
jgi:hypothetical protein